MENVDKKFVFDGENKIYELEDVLEMLGGYEYFEYEQVQYVFHKLNKRDEEAQHYLDICLERAEKVKNMLKKMKEIKMNELQDAVTEMINVAEKQEIQEKESN
jgi:hypothetical protein